MIKGDFQFDIKEAIKSPSNAIYDNAYYSTNEPLQWETGIVPPAGKRVLTVASSGDHPILYAAYGASHVDTFDITYNACVITDIKMAALQIMGFDEYKRFIGQIYDLSLAAPMYNGFSDIINHMQTQTGQTFKQYIKNRPDAFYRECPYTISVPENLSEYKKMQNTVKRPFDFIWTDLMNLHKHLTGKYDIINISNIFDHYLSSQLNRGPGDIVQTVKNLWPYVTIGGHIICLQMAFGKTVSNTLSNILPGQISSASVKHLNAPDPWWHAIVIKKER